MTRFSLLGCLAPPMRAAAALAAGWTLPFLPALAQDRPCATLAVDTAIEQVGHVRRQGADCGARGAFGPAGALVWNARLEGLAREQATWLADYGLLIHTGRGGITLSQRALAAGYRFARVAENLAQGQADVSEVLAAWAASDGHCANLYDPQVTEMALACAPGADGRAMWVLILGRPLPAPP